MVGKRSNGEGTLRRRPNGLWECSMMVGYADTGDFGSGATAH